MTDHPPQQPGPQPWGNQAPQPGMPAAPQQPTGYVPFGAPSPAPTPGPSGVKMAGIVIGSVVAVFALAGVVFGLTRNDAGDASSVTVAETTVETSPATALPDTDPPETVQPDTVPPDTASPETVSPETVLPETTDTVSPDTAVDEPPSTDGEVPLTEIAQLLAWTSFSEEPLDAAAERVEVEQLIVTQTIEAVAHPTAVATLCAGIPMDAPIDLSVVWQFDGSTVQVDPFAGEPPGVGSCLGNDGAPLSAGAYQVFASNDDESDVGFVTTFVIGATGVNQTFVNNTGREICDIGVAPLSTAYYEFFTSTDGPILPGEFITIDVASVDQDLRVRTCDGEDLDSLTFSPNSFGDQPMAP